MTERMPPVLIAGEKKRNSPAIAVLNVPLPERQLER
jgi:hypothetical protein